MNESRELLTRKEAAELLRTTPATMATGHCDGTLHLPYVKFKRKVLYRRSDIDLYIEAHLHGAENNETETEEDNSVKRYGKPIKE